MQALRQRLSCPLVLDPPYRSAFGTSQSASDWRMPLLRPDVVRAAVPHSAAEPDTADSLSQDNSASPTTFSSLGLDKGVTVRMKPQTGL